MTTDFVIAWVDDTDEKWLTEKNRYIKDYVQDDMITGDCRYRDWDIIKYWFRSIEKYAPWVRKIHFVTYGHLPDFLKVSHPKLNIVNHSDYIPEEYLPTFSSRTIELNFHRIRDLSEQFVYFNDDMFVNAPINEKDFFKKGKPRGQLFEKAIMPKDSAWYHVVLNDMGLINKHFSKRELIKHHLFKYLNPKYGKRNKHNLMTVRNPLYQEIENMHMPNPLLKSTIEEIWKEEYKVLHETSKNKFRTVLDVNQYLFSGWNIAKGNFYPSANIGKAYLLNAGNLEACADDIKNGKHRLICVNDTQNITDFESAKNIITEAFEMRYPDKSEFEI